MINTHFLNISTSIKRQFKERLLQTLHTAETCRRPTCTTHHLSILILEYDKFRSPKGRIKTVKDQKNLFGIFILKVIAQYTLPYRCINRIFLQLYFIYKLEYFPKIFYVKFFCNF